MNDDNNLNDLDAGVWANSHGKYSVVPAVVETLPAGCYLPEVNMEGTAYLIKQDISIDELVLLSDSISKKVVDEIKLFWSKKSTFEEYGFVHKRGFLLAGPPGGGKTVTINLVVKTIVEEYNGIALYMTTPSKTVRNLHNIRSIETERPILVIIEDIDEVIKYHGESVLLDVLDGGSQINNVIFIATTNYVNKLEDRIIKRPSRFDTVIFVNPPNIDLRRAFLESKDPNITAEELDVWSKISEGLNFAHLKEMIIMVRCLGASIEDAVDKLKHVDLKKEECEYESNKSEKGRLGFDVGSGTHLLDEGDSWPQECMPDRPAPSPDYPGPYTPNIQEQFKENK